MNYLEYSQTTCNILSTVVPPDPPSAVMVTATTTAQISLSWTNPSDGNSPITMVTVAYQQTGGQNSTDTATRFTSHTITGLMPNMEYTIFIESFNDIGGSGSVSMTGTTRPLRKFYYVDVIMLMLLCL